MNYNRPPAGPEPVIPGQVPYEPPKTFKGLTLSDWEQFFNSRGWQGIQEELEYTVEARKKTLVAICNDSTLSRDNILLESIRIARDIETLSIVIHAVETNIAILMSPNLLQRLEGDTNAAQRPAVPTTQS